MTMFECPIGRQTDTLAVRLGSQLIRIDEQERQSQPGIAERAESEVIVGIRPEGIAMCTHEHCSRRVSARVEFQEVLGSSVIVFFMIEGSRGVGPSHRHGRVSVNVDGGGGALDAPRSSVLTPARFAASTRFSPGDVVQLCLAAGAMRFFDRETEIAI
jgi:ABC-type sugar transport system ATPase subunit